MENVFADTSGQINTEYSVVEALDKPKRSAFVFMTADSDSSLDALQDLRKIDEVEEVYLAKGAYDLVAKISGVSLDYLRESVLKRIKNLSSIKSTLTLTVI